MPTKPCDRAGCAMESLRQCPKCGWWFCPPHRVEEGCANWIRGGDHARRAGRIRYTAMDYRMVADALRLAFNYAEEHPEYGAEDILNFMVGVFQAKFERDNPRFKPGRFGAACAPETKRLHTEFNQAGR